MMLLTVLVCFFTFLQASLSTPISASKPKPVDLAFTCSVVVAAEKPDIEPDNVPIILLHGFTANKETWHGLPQVLALETKKKVCAADLRNHGQSPWNDVEYDVVAMTEDLTHLMDRIGAQKAIVLGHSLGGKIAVHLALTYPERVEKIIVEDMRPNGITPEALSGIHLNIRALKEVEKHIPQGVTEREAKEEVSRFISEYLSKMNITFKQDDLDWIPVMCSNGKCQLRVNPFVLDVNLRNITDLLNVVSGRFEGPALFIYGAKSSLRVGEDENNIKKLFPNAEIVGVEGAGHLVHTSRKYMTEVVKFIKSK